MKAKDIIRRESIHGIKVTRIRMSTNVPKVIAPMERPRLDSVLVVSGELFITPVDKLKYVPKWFPGKTQAVSQVFQQLVVELCIVFDRPKRVWFWTGCWSDYQQLVQMWNEEISLDARQAEAYALASK